MERPPQHQKSIFHPLPNALTEVEEPAPRESDLTYWGCQLDRFALTAANEHLGEVKSYYDP